MVPLVLYTEPAAGAVVAALNSAIQIERGSKYVREWLARLEKCAPNTLHTTLVDSTKIPNLFHPCVRDDPDSPSAVGADGCVCYQTSWDPEFGLPVVEDHFRTAGGGTDNWTYHSYAPLGLRDGDTFGSLIIDQEAGLFWIRTGEGTLAFLPEERGRGYGVGYGGGGPSQLGKYIQRLVATNGQATAARETDLHGNDVDPRIFAWVTSTEAARTQELTLKDLVAIQRG